MADRAPNYNATQFRHDPYACRVIDYARGQSPGPEPCIEPGTLHCPLAGVVNFVPYPLTVMTVDTAPPKNVLWRLFIGQLPYDSTVVQAEWIIRALTGVQCYYTEMIHSWRNPQHTPKGCVHTYCFPEDADRVIAMLHHAVLVDDTGVWFAADDEQFGMLNEYCREMKEDKTKRFRNRPYQPLVAEIADSTFVPHSSRNAFAGTPPPYDLSLSASPEPGMLPPTYEETVAVFDAAAP